MNKFKVINKRQTFTGMQWCLHVKIPKPDRGVTRPTSQLPTVWTELN